MLSVSAEALRRSREGGWNILRCGAGEKARLLGGEGSPPWRRRLASLAPPATPKQVLGCHPLLVALAKSSSIG